MKLQHALTGQIPQAMNHFWNTGGFLALLPDGLVNSSTAAVLQAEIAEDFIESTSSALIVPTSGSTRNPKWVILRRKAIEYSVKATHDRLGGQGHWVCPLPRANIAGAMTIVRGLASGMGTSFIAADLNDLRFPTQRSYISLVPTQLHRALQEPRTLKKLQLYAAILVGGQNVAESLYTAAIRAELNVIRTYGMSETCGGCVYDGVPLAGVQVEIEAATQAQQIVLDTPTAFSGYFADPKATAAVLVGTRVRTQDRGSWDGQRLHVIGRVDDVVISGGVNVDLAAVQLRMDEIWGVGEDSRIVVFAVPDPRWGERIVAFTKSSTTTGQVREKLDSFFEPTAIPKEVRQLPTCRLGLGAKIKRNELAAIWQRGENGIIG